PGIAAAKPRAFDAQAGPRGAMNGAVDAASAHELAVGGVDDGVDVERRDVGDDDVESGRADLGGEQGHLILSSSPGRRGTRRDPVIALRMAQPCSPKRDGRDIRAFTPVFDGLCPAMTNERFMHTFY